jgi:hypothetical protein
MMTHIQKLVSAACLVLLFLSCSVSKAQETTTTYQMGDDGYIGIKIPFNFNFYGQMFNNSWMYDNGVVSFIDPATNPYALSPWQWSSVPLSQVQSRYFIAALWSDLSPTSSTVYSSTTDGSFLKYSWNNISEYYSGGTRLSTFSTTIRPDGSINTNYYSLNLNSSNISVGTVGDPSKGEFNEVYWASAGTQVNTGTIPDWTQMGGESSDPCATTMSASCPGYTDYLLKLIPSQETSSPTTTEPIVATYQLLPPTTSTSSTSSADSIIESSVVSSTSATQSAPVTSPTPTLSNPQPKIGEVQTAGSNRPSMSQIMSILNSEQSRLQQTEKMVADQVKDISDAAEATAMNASSQSMEAAIESSNRSSGPTAAVVNSLSNVPGSALNFGVATSANQAYGVPEIQQTPAEAFNTASFRPSQPVVDSASQLQENKTQQDLVLGDIVYGAPVVIEMQETKTSVNTKAKDNDAAGSVSIASIANVPIGYEAYSIFSLKDIPFYPPTQVYKNQRTVDNLRVLRAMNVKSDTIHQKMVNEQYNRGN